MTATLIPPEPVLTDTATPDRAAAEAFAAAYPIVPVYQELMADTITPVTAFAKLRQADGAGFLLESVAGTGSVGRFSYIGHRPRPVELPDGDPLVELRSALAEGVAPVAGLPPFHGGLVGYLGYEAARHFERLPVAPGSGPAMPESVFLHAEDLAVFDHATRRLLLITAYRPALERYDDALARLDDMRDRLLHPGPQAELDGRPLGALGSGRYDPSVWRSNVTREQFGAMVERAKEHILAGDAFQIVLSQRFSKTLDADPLDVYRHLRAVNPSPYMFHLALGDGRHVIGASPELLVKVEQGAVRVRPLAGTRRRGADPAADLALEAELRADEKERAEHVMLVDLGRNDVGRVAAPGSVRVDRLMAVERYSHVMHLSSTVSATLAEDRDCLDALRATFPAGTVSGAPKIRAMEIIAELEPEPRGVYGGALGFVGFGGDLDTAIVLRTVVVADGRAYVQAGAGVVADSDPAAEYQETLNKAGAMFAAIERAEARA